jgi:hypothetical protein
MAFNSTGVMPTTRNDGMLEQWNNAQKWITSVFGSSVIGSIFTLSLILSEA